MALFGKKKKELGAMPPAPPSVSGASAPVAPPVAPIGNISEPVNNIESLSIPPLPGGNLDDIKNEVAQAPSPSLNAQTLPSASETSTQETTNIGTNVQEVRKELDEDKILSDDSLFDFSELETEITSRSPDFKEISSQNNEQEEDFDPIEHKGTVTENELESLNFVNGNKRVVSANETYFLTTKQFKSLLGIVEDVKIKVKDSAETHLKLLDIKAEEEIEYDNLRKNFQFIEDKLYEVDSLIFEK